jgi:hypothetical protein
VHQSARAALLFTHWSCSDDRDLRRRPTDDCSQEVDDMIDRHDDELDLVVCPECAAPAEVLDRFGLGSTAGTLEHVKIQCLARHWFLMPVTMLPTMGTIAAPSGAGPVR